MPHMSHEPGEHGSDIQRQGEQETAGGGACSGGEHRATAAAPEQAHRAKRHREGHQSTTDLVSTLVTPGQTSMAR